MPSYKGTSARAALARQARTGPHWNAHTPSSLPLEPGDKVQLRNGQKTTVKDKTQYGYTVEGVEGYFDAGNLKKI